MLTKLKMDYHGYWEYTAQLHLRLWEQCYYQSKEGAHLMAWDRILNPLDQANKRELQTALGEL